MWKKYINYFSFFLFFYLYYTIYSYEYIEIPFKRKLFFNESSTISEIIFGLSENIMSSEVNIGSPPQKLLMNILSKVHYTYLISEYPEFNTNKSKQIVIYQSNNSTTHYTLERTGDYNKLCSIADYSVDTFLFNNKYSLNNLTFLEIFEYRGYIESLLPSDSGVLGFGLINSEENEEISQENLKKANFIYNLKKNNTIESYEYFFEYDNETNGKIILGINPINYKNKYSEKLSGILRMPNYKVKVLLGFHFESLSYNGIEIDLTNYNKDAEIVFEYGFIGLSDKIKQILKDDYFGILLQKGICFEENTSLIKSIFICKKSSSEFNKKDLKSLDFYSSEISQWIKIDLSNLFYDYGDYSYFLVEFCSTYSVILGEPFLRNNLFTINQDTKTIQFFYDKINETKGNMHWIIAFLIITVLFIIVLGLLLCLIRIAYNYTRKSRRLRQSDIIEEYDYSSNKLL